MGIFLVQSVTGVEPASPGFGSNFNTADRPPYRLSYAPQILLIILSKNVRKEQVRIRGTKSGGSGLFSKLSEYGRGSMGLGRIIAEVFRGRESAKK